MLPVANTTHYLLTIGLYKKQLATLECITLLFYFKLHFKIFKNI